MFALVPLDVLSVDMVPLGTGQRIQPSQVELLTVNIDHRGQLLLGKQPVTADGLIKKLRPVEPGVEPPMLFVAMSKYTEVDRAPVVLNLMKRFVSAGFKKYTFVGPPTDKVDHSSN